MRNRPFHQSVSEFHADEQLQAGGSAGRPRRSGRTGHPKIFPRVLFYRYFASI